MSQSSQNKTQQTLSIEKTPNFWQQVLYKGQYFEVRPEHINDLKPFVIPRGPQQPGWGPPPEFELGMTVQELLIKGGIFAKGEHDGGIETFGIAVLSLRDPRFNGESKGLFSLFLIGKEAEGLQKRVTTHNDWYCKVIGDLLTTPHQGEEGEIKYTQMIERRIETQAREIRQAGTRLRRDFLILEADERTKVSMRPLRPSLTATLADSCIPQGDRQLLRYLEDRKRGVDNACLAAERALSL